MDGSACDLRRSFLFACASEELLSSAESQFVAGWRPARRVLFHQGSAAGTIFLLTSGHVRLTRVTAGGKIFLVGFIGAGEVFGEEAVFAPSQRCSTATVVDDASYSTCTSSALRGLMERWPLLALNMAKYLQEQRIAAMSTIEDVAYLPVPQRILNLLERLANEDGVVEDDGTRIDLHLTHADIAAMIGSTRETVSTELARLVKSRRVLVRDRSYVWPRCTQPPIRLEPLDIADLRVAPIVIRLASTSVV